MILESFADGLQESAQVRAEAELMLVGREVMLGTWNAQLRERPSQIAARVAQELARSAERQAQSFAFRRNSEMARELGTTYPLVQGPMATVSENVAFARAVAKAGALPVLALGTLDDSRRRSLLREVRRAEIAPFGVGLVGFDGSRRHKDQVADLADFAPSWVILAGGTPAQASELSARGLPVFAHSPSPKLARAFLEQGVSHLILEGCESGGHVGELSSQMLWEGTFTEIAPILGEDKNTRIALLLAGGIATKAASVYAAVASTRLQSLGALVGLQLGTAYLNTHEAIDSDVVTPLYQQLIHSASETCIVGRPLGHPVRVLRTPLAERTIDLERQLESGAIDREALASAVSKNAKGRLYLASRGVRSSDCEDKGEIVAAPDEQVKEALFMAGEASVLLDAPETAADLHARLSERSSEIARSLLEGPWCRPPPVPCALKVLEPTDRPMPALVLLGAPSRQDLSVGLEALTAILRGSPRAEGEVLRYLVAPLLRQFQPGSCGVALVGSTSQELLSRAEAVREALRTDRRSLLERGLAFIEAPGGQLAIMFPGQGSLRPGTLGSVLGRFEPLRAHMQFCRSTLQQRFGVDPFEYFCGKDAKLEERWLEQPLLWSLETGLIAWLEDMGVRADFFAGHSLGELAGLQALGLLPVDSSLELVVRRAQLMAPLGAGGMTAIRGSLEQVEQVLALTGSPLRVSNINSPSQIVVSGEADLLSELEGLLTASGINFKRLAPPQALHTEAMQPAATGFARVVTEQVTRSINDGWLGADEASFALGRLMSNVTARSYNESLENLRRLIPPDGEEAESRLIAQTMGVLLGEHISSPVRFREVLDSLYRQGARLFLEVGPGAVLGELARVTLEDKKDVLTLSLAKGPNELESVLLGVGVLALAGRAPALVRRLDLKEGPSSHAPNQKADIPKEAGIEPPRVFGSRPHRGRAPWMRPDDIVVVGMGIEVAGASDLEQFWENLLREVDASAKAPTHKWDSTLFFDPDPTATDCTYSDRCAAADFDVSDSSRFGFQPSTLSGLDRMQVVSLKLVETLLADAGWNAREYPHRDTAVILGYAFSEAASGAYAGRIYLHILERELHQALSSHGQMDSQAAKVIRDVLSREYERGPAFTSATAVAVLGNMISARIARYLDLDQPNFVIDSACASSLSALDMAILQLRAGRCRYAITGGLDDFSVGRQIGFSKALAVSRKGRCTPFDATADGLIQGDGAAALLLTTFEQAQVDGRRIRGIIRGIGGSSDGRRSRGIMLPSVEGQALSAQRCLADAEWDPADLDYIEAHGTGTLIGDVTEIQSLNNVFGESTSSSIPLGSVKANVGHTMVASGAVSLVKTFLALERGLIPGMTNLETLNPRLQLEETPFVVSKSFSPCLRRSPSTPRRAMVCSYGFGGTNHHVALEEYLPAQSMDGTGNDRPRLLLFGADSIEELKGQIEQAIARGPIASLEGNGMPRPRHGRFTAGLVVKPDTFIPRLQQALARLAQGNPGWAERIAEGLVLSDSTLGPTELRPAILFPGHGGHYPDMGVELYDACAPFREVINLRRRNYLAPYRHLRDTYERLGSFIVPPETSESDHSLSLLMAIGSVNLAYLRILDLIGVRPAAIAGYSLGELTALLASGALDLTSYCRLEEISLDSFREVGAKQQGWMSSVVMDKEDLLRHLAVHDGQVDLAMSLAPRLHVISGASAAMERLELELARNDTVVTRIASSHPYHWRGLSPIEQPLRDRIREHVRPGMPVLPFYSALAEAQAPGTPEDVLDLCVTATLRPLDPAAQIASMQRDGVNLFIEAGANTTYANMLRIFGNGRKVRCVSLDAAPGSGSRWARLLEAIAELHCLGLPIDPDGLSAIGALGPYQEDHTPMQHELAAYRHSHSKGQTMDRNRYRIIMEYMRANEQIAQRALNANREALRLLFDPEASMGLSELGSIAAQPDASQSLPSNPTKESIAASHGPAITQALEQSVQEPTASDRQQAASLPEDILKGVISIITEVTGFAESQLRPELCLTDELGLDSIQQMLVIDAIDRHFETDLMKHVQLDGPPETLGQLAQLVAKLRGSSS